MNPGIPPEQWSREELNRWQIGRLRELLTAVVPENVFWSGKLRDAGIDPARIQTLEDLRRLPLTTKAELAADQVACPPYGRNLTHPLTDYSRFHQTSGTTTGQPLRWLDT